jgi:uncharacterized phage protein (TIGR01671 family)
MLKRNGRSAVALLRYRAWDVELKSMKEVTGIDYRLECVELSDSDGDTYIQGFSNIKLMQSTGLTDKNGKEIFEGDIIDSTDGFLTGVVEFRVGLGMFISELVEYNNFERLCNVASSRKIIGNIWEHPELAEVSP